MKMKTATMSAMLLIASIALLAPPAAADEGACNNYGNQVNVGTGNWECTYNSQECHQGSGAGAGAGAGAAGPSSGNDAEAGASAGTTTNCTQDNDEPDDGSSGGGSSGGGLREDLFDLEEPVLDDGPGDVDWPERDDTLTWPDPPDLGDLATPDLQ